MVQPYSVSFIVQSYVYVCNRTILIYPRDETYPSAPILSLSKFGECVSYKLYSVGLNACVCVCVFCGCVFVVLFIDQLKQISC